jgi:uncharacterized protein YjeT (DUF2065 family)
MFAWSHLGAALALMCVVEGLLPFIRPSATRRVFARLLELSDRELRIGGLCSMVAGAVLLILVRS